MQPAPNCKTGAEKAQESQRQPHTARERTGSALAMHDNLPAQHFVLHLLFVIPFSIHPRVICLCSWLPNARLFLFHPQQLHPVGSDATGQQEHAGGAPSQPLISSSFGLSLRHRAPPGKGGTGHINWGVSQAGILQGREVAPSSTSTSWLWVTGTS